MKFTNYINTNWLTIAFSMLFLSVSYAQDPGWGADYETVPFDYEFSATITAAQIFIDGVKVMKAAVLYNYDEALTADTFVKYEDVPNPKIINPTDDSINLNEEGLLGPNAYKVKKINYLTDDTYKDAFINQGNKLVSKTITKISQDYSGIRPKIEYKNKINDFIINEDSKGLFNLIGIDSPGLTSSLAIAEYINNKI